MNQITILTRQQVVDAVNAIRNGSYTKITYKTEPTVKAAYKKQGYKVVKVTEVCGRLGVDYDNIKTVIDRKVANAGNPVKQTVNNYSWVIKNKLAFNSATGKEYLRITVGKNHNTKSEYAVFDAAGNEVTGVDWKDYVIPSYFNKTGEPSEVRNIKLENIIKIKDEGVSYEFK